MALENVVTAFNFISMEQPIMRSSRWCMDESSRHLVDDVWIRRLDDGCVDEVVDEGCIKVEQMV